MNNSINLPVVFKLLRHYGINMTDISKKTGIRITTLYHINGGRVYSDEKMDFVTRSINHYYGKEISKLRELEYEF